MSVTFQNEKIFPAVMLALFLCLSSCSSAPSNLSYAPEADEPEISDQWWAKSLGLKEAWRYATGNGVTIADCDSGFLPYEPDIYQNLILNKARDLADHDNQYLISDGNFPNNGTAHSAIMVGKMDHSGTNGIAYNSRLIPLQAYNYDSSLDDMPITEAVKACIDYAAKTEARIIVIEVDTYYTSVESNSLVRASITNALAAGKVVITSAGNYGYELKAEAENDTGSIIVGALRKDGNTANFSNYGSRVTISAFGEKIYTLLGPDGRMGNFGTTSAAAAQVAGTVALMLEANPKLTPKQVKYLLQKTRKINSYNSKVGGQLNAGAAVKAASKPLCPNQ